MVMILYGENYYKKTKQGNLSGRRKQNPVERINIQAAMVRTVKYVGKSKQEMTV